MFKRLSYIIKQTKVIPQNIQKQNKLTSELIARYSNGNVSLQRGNYITKDELRQKEKVIFAHSFI